MLDDIIDARKKKLESFHREGVLAYPSSVTRTYSIGDIVKRFAPLMRARTRVAVAGRLMGVRDQGNLLFVDCADETGRIQLILKKDTLPNFSFLKGVIDIGDFIEVIGTLFRTKKGERSILASGARVLAKSLRPLPSEWYGLNNTEERFRKRYLDMLLNEATRARLTVRAHLLRALRERFSDEGFLEVETPILQPIPGGALARPFVTHHNALDQDFYLRIAPELYLKRLLVGGFEKIFEIGRVFRNEGIDRDHNPEFTMLELYWAYQDWKGLMKFIQKVFKRYIPGKWETITYAEAIKHYAGNTISNLAGHELDEIFKKEVRPHIVKPTFVTHYPKSISPLAKSCADNPDFTERFQLIADGTELMNGFSELNDPLDQRARMEEQEKRYRGGDPEASRMDEEFLEALEYGMPPAAGLGIGIDRLVAYITKTHNIKEIIAFPTLRSKE